MLSKKISLAALWLMLAVIFTAQGLAQETKIKWFGHAAFSITTPKGKVLLVDPWLKNPLKQQNQPGWTTTEN